MKMRSIIYILTLLMLLNCGCDNFPPPPRSAGGSQSPRTATTSSGSYQPIYPARTDWKDFAPGTINYDYNYAACSPTVAVAAERWKRYIEDHAIIQDGFSKHYLIAAKMELARVYFMQGKRSAGDAILKEFDFSTLEFAR